MTALAAGHLGTDFANGALPALLPFLTDRFSLSYTLAAVLMLASTASSSLVQPLFGLWSDRRGAIWLLPDRRRGRGRRDRARRVDALVLARRRCSSSSRGSASPRSTRRDRSSPPTRAATKRASGMSAFSIGGNIGYALGPIVATPLVLCARARAAACCSRCRASRSPAVLLALTPFLRTFEPRARRAAPRRRARTGPARSCCCSA